MAKQEFFDAVAKELEQQHLDRGLWTKAFAEADGDDARARALYIRLRAAQLEQEVLASKGQRGRRQIYGYVIILIVAVFVLLALLVISFLGKPSSHGPPIITIAGRHLSTSATLQLINQIGEPIFRTTLHGKFIRCCRDPLT
jgi:hypothetical protein